MHRNARHAALEQGESVYFTGLPCSNGHVAERYSKSGYCKACAKEAGRKAYRANPKRFSKASRKWRAKNPEYSETNRARINANSQDYRRKNLSKTAALRAQYRARKKQTQPNWLGREDLQRIAEAYDLAAQKSVETGLAWEVDHIVPLAGKNVCGLHVPWNLQVIPRSVNRKKSNNFDSQMEGIH